MSIHSFTDSKSKYTILDVSPLANAEDLKIAYRRMAMLYHPDRHLPEDRPLADGIFRRIAAAYATLSDPDKRARYDAALARGIHLEDDDPESVSLEDVLAALHSQEYIFSDKSLSKLSADLHEMVRTNLNSELNEQVVEVLPIGSKPAGLTTEGDFKKGGLVLTNWRMLLPFSTSWTTQSGNVKTIHTRHYMPSVALPYVRKVKVISSGRRKPKTLLEITTEERSLTAVLSSMNVGKILLLCRMWGIPVSASETVDKARERRWILIWRPFWLACLAAIVIWIGWSGPAQALALAFLTFAGYGWVRQRWMDVQPSPTEALVGLKSKDNGVALQASA